LWRDSLRPSLNSGADHGGIGLANAADPKAMQNGVAFRRRVGRPGQVAPEVGHRFARRIWELDVSVRRRRLDGAADQAGQDNRRADDPH
jgi:hypothetical protein